MAAFYSALALPAIMTVVVLGPNIVGGNHDNEKPHYSPLVRHAAVPPPIIPEIEFDTNPIGIKPTPTPQPRPIQPAPAVLPASRSTPIPQRPVVQPPTQASNNNSIYAVVARYFPEQPDRAYRVAQCESSSPTTPPNPRAINSVNKAHFGMWQFSIATWYSVGGTGNPIDASVEEQTMRARLLYERRGWQPWSCA